MLVEALEQIEGFRVGRCGSLIIVHLSRQMLVSDMALLMAVFSRQEGTFSLLFLIASGLKEKISKEVRERSARDRALFEKRLIGTAVVEPGGGLGSAVLQLFLAGYSLLVRTPLRLFVAPELAMRWLGQLPRQDPAVRDVDAAELLREFRVPG